VDRAAAFNAASLHLASLTRRSHFPQTAAALIASVAHSLDRLAVAEEFIVARFYSGTNPELAKEDSGGAETSLGRERADTLLRSLVLAKATLEGRSRTPIQVAFAAQAGIFLPDMDDDEGSTYIDGGGRHGVDGEQQKRFLTIPEINFVLNALSAFLYMISYTAVLPTAGTYAQRLGSSRAASGVLIGGAPLAGIFSAILFSSQSNFGYKSPLLLSSLLCMVGNVLYSLAWTFQSFPLAVVGRLIVGLGGARAVNRRFIADCSARATLVARSADFVTSSAVGMAAGPALSAMLSATLPNVSIAGIMFDDATNPAWMCAVLWAILVAALVHWFQEPERPVVWTEGTAAEPDAPLLPQRRETRDGAALFNYGATNASTATATLRTSPPNSVRSSAGRDLLRNTPVLFCLFLYFCIKVVCDLFVSSTPLVLSYHYGWSESSIGMFVALFGVLIFPANHVVARLARKYDDSTQLVFAVALVTVGCLLSIPIVSNPPPVGEYILAAVVVFISTNVAEAVLMAILARLMPRSLARGTFNSGLLSTEAGMIGRSCGNVGVTIAASGKQGLDRLMWRAFLPCVILSILMLRGTWAMKGRLREDDSEQGSLSGESDVDDGAEQDDGEEGVEWK
jgi:MFS family permease